MKKVVTKAAMFVVPYDGEKITKQVGESRFEDFINITTMGSDKIIEGMRDTESRPFI